MNVGGVTATPTHVSHPRRRTPPPTPTPPDSFITYLAESASYIYITSLSLAAAFVPPPTLFCFSLITRHHCSLWSLSLFFFFCAPFPAQKRDIFKIAWSQGKLNLFFSLPLSGFLTVTATGGLESQLKVSRPHWPGGAAGASTPWNVSPYWPTF